MNEKRFKEIVDELSQPIGFSISDEEAYDAAEFILFDEKGLEEYMRNVKGISDPIGWLADEIHEY